MKKKIIIGRVEKIDLPLIGFEDVEVKVDTGAYTNSLNYSKMRIKEGILIVDILLNEKIRRLKFSEYTKSVVKSSNGVSEERFVISTVVKIGKKKIRSEFNLSYRSMMKYPILLGRKFLNGRFIVDVEMKKLV